MNEAQKAEPFLLGHPRGLFILFFTEMWERMSYYGMRVLLMIYMTDYLFTESGTEVLGLGLVRALVGESGALRVDALSSKIFGLYTGLAYFTPFFGGMLSDAVLGRRRSILLGGALMMVGHFLMASEQLFFVALFVLVLGNGAFKPNISAQVGMLYPEGDPRRDAAFTLFYMGINLGAFIAPLVCGTLGQRYGWHYGFAAAGVGMAFGLAGYQLSAAYLPVDVYGAARREENAAGRGQRSEDVQRVVSLVSISMLSTFFWAAYEQQGNSLQLWAHRRTDLHVLGFEIPSTWYQTLNPLMILLLAPLLDRLWAFQRKGGREPDTVLKMVFGCFLLAAAYLVMMAAAALVPADVPASLLWLVSATFLLTVGELYVSPVGLSLISRTAPLRMVATLMGVWYFSNFAGNLLGGYIGSLTGDIGHYRLFFVFFGLSVLPGVLLLALRRALGPGLSSRAPSPSAAETPPAS